MHATDMRMSKRLKKEEPRSGQTGVQEQRSADAERLDSWNPGGVASEAAGGAAQRPARGHGDVSAHRPAHFRSEPLARGGDDRQLQCEMTHHGGRFR